jgi:hypothetical protein
VACASGSASAWICTASSRVGAIISARGWFTWQLKVLESGVDILIGTTGRLIDYAKQNHINLGAIQAIGKGRGEQHVQTLSGRRHAAE